MDRTLVSQAQLDWLRQIAVRSPLPPITFLVPFGLLSSVTMSFVSAVAIIVGALLAYDRFLAAEPIAWRSMAAPAE